MPPALGCRLTADGMATARQAGGEAASEGILRLVQNVVNRPMCVDRCFENSMLFPGVAVPCSSQRLFTPSAERNGVPVPESLFVFCLEFGNVMICENGYFLVVKEKAKVLIGACIDKLCSRYPKSR